MIFANMWCSGWVIDLLGKTSGGEMNALVRTTVAFTQMEGSSARNVIPPEAKMVANMRLNPSDSVESALAYLRKVINDGKMWLDRGVSVAIFPEGTRSKTGEIERFKGGAFALAKEAGVEILPVVLDGTRDIFRKKSFWFNWKHHLTVKVLPPISAERVVATDTSELANEVREMMVEALAEIRKS